MKNQKKQNGSKPNIKALAIEKLRTTEGGRTPITPDLKDIGIAGGIMGYPPPGKSE